jgi:hypothetical protein
MRDREEHGLDKEDYWAWDTAKMQEPVKNRRVVVSVSFSAEDFHRVASHATQIDVRISTFIRQAALEKLKREVPVLIFSWSAGNRSSAMIPNVKNVYTGAAQPRYVSPEPVPTG